MNNLRKSTRKFFAVAILATISVSCRAESSQFIGLVRDEPLDVSSVYLSEETNSMLATPFNTVAAPGELLILFFGYTNCPDICPTTLADVRAAFARIGDDANRVAVAFVTVDPERDTAQLLTNYLSSFVDRFHVLRTTDFNELQVAKDAFLAASAIQKTTDGTIEVSHTATAYIINESGLVVDELPFGVGVDGFENDLKILLREIEPNNS